MDLPPTWGMVHQTDPGSHFPETPQDQALQAHPPTWESWTITQLSLKPCNCFSPLGVVAWAPVPFQTRCSTSSVKRWLFTIELNISSSPHHPGDKSGSTEQPHVGKEGQGRDPPTRPTVRQDFIQRTSWTGRILTRYEPNRRRLDLHCAYQAMCWEGLMPCGSHRCFVWQGSLCPGGQIDHL